MERSKQPRLLHSAAQTALFLHSIAQFNDQYHYHHGMNMPHSQSQRTRTFMGTIMPLIHLIKQTIIYAIVGMILFFTSVVAYGILYWMIMPKPYATEPIFFDYYNLDCHRQGGTATSTGSSSGGGSGGGGMNGGVFGEGVSVGEGHTFCPPTANVNLISKQTQWEAYLLDVSPDPDYHVRTSASSTSTVQEDDTVVHENAGHTKKGRGCDMEDDNVLIETQHGEHSCKNDDGKVHNNSHDKAKVSSPPPPRVLLPYRPYFIQVALTLAESPYNQNIGMFMLRTILKDSTTTSTGERTVLASSTRPTMLPYQSTYVSMVKKSFIMIPLILGAVPEARTVVIDCFDRFIESRDHPLGMVEVQLMVPPVPSSQNKLQNVQVLKAELRIGRELNFVQRSMKEWFYTCACVVIVTLMGLQALVLFLLQQWWLYLVHMQKMSLSSSSPSTKDHCHTSYANAYGEEASSSSVVNIDMASERDADVDHLSSSSDFSLLDDSEHNDKFHHDDDDSDQWEEIVKNDDNGDESDDGIRKRNEVITEANERTGDTRINPTNDEKNSMDGKHHADTETNDLGRATSDDKHKTDNEANDSSSTKLNHGHGNQNAAKKKKRRKRKKKKKISKDKSELANSQSTTSYSSTVAEAERLKAERVMRGDLSRYEVFTDRDDPDI